MIKLATWLVAIAVIVVTASLFCSFVWLEWYNPLASVHGRGIIAAISIVVGLKILNMEGEDD